MDPIADERLADFVVSSHMRSHPAQQQKNPENQAGEDMQQGACVGICV